MYLLTSPLTHLSICSFLSPFVMYLLVHLTNFLSVYLSATVPDHLFICPSVHLTNHMSINLSATVSVHLCICLSLSIYPPTHQFIRPAVSISIRMSVRNAYLGGIEWGYPSSLKQCYKVLIISSPIWQPADPF